MIEFRNVYKRYPQGLDALADINFGIAQGTLTLLQGHSGAGKSTLLKLIAAIERPTAGIVTVKGENIGAIKRAAIPWLRRNIGMIFQDQKLLLDRNAFDNVMLPLAITGFPPKEAERRVRAALDKVGLADKENAMPVALSGGEQQRLAIARAVVSRPALLLADEPTAHLDPDNAREVARLFHEFQQVGVTVVIATHDEALYAPYAPHRIALDHGRIIGHAEKSA
ncbi:MAG TPA: ATP-binding cassette domain-containing protein [Rhodocyclaceae bacterium]|nr:ATP-binding cassette domain-containing protein [Rhodocyclaceae bacterium]